MSFHGYTRRDNNEAKIVQALIQAGATVEKMHMRGVPDLLVGFQGYNYLIEIKDKTAKLQPSQVKWHQGWQGQCTVVYNAQQALQTIGFV